MISAEWLRSASFHEVWGAVIDPWLVASQQRDTFSAMTPAQRDLIRAWLLHGVACRSGLGSLVTEEPPWIAEGMRDSLVRLGFATLAELWAEGTRGMEFAAWHGEIPAEVCFTSTRAIAALQEELAAGTFAQLPELLVERLRVEPGICG
ncbi:hypothetical protein [Nannocystis bainbridge]|uniref:Uncharacterized protein n=1 Tax=Nannocystis bainbridge TaxID=2995303 RepID=A0ABT5E5Q7_9BACT|nr:hypothetical protein [Nannocystis bainbridge]MDC0720778.1 hypothetical protein [Nannocystis bainbridge]